MSEYHRRRVEIQGALDHFPGIHLGAVNRAAKERLMGNKLILVVQIQHPELFPLKRGHMQPQPLAYGVGGSEGHPGLMQVAVQNAERSLNETPVLGVISPGKKESCFIRCSSGQSMMRRMAWASGCCRA